MKPTKHSYSTDDIYVKTVCLKAEQKAQDAAREAEWKAESSASEDEFEALDALMTEERAAFKRFMWLTCSSSFLSAC